MTDEGQIKLFLYPHTRRIVAKYAVEIRAESELLVGGGSFEQATSPFDIPVAKMPWGDSFIPYIPGSTLKGLLRATAEEMMRALFSDASKSVAEVFERIKAEEVGAELVEKAVIKLLQQFISPELVRAEDVVKASGDNLRRKVEEAYRQKNVEVSRILTELKVTPYACPTVVEGLACELPLPPYKVPYLKALAKASGLDPLPYPCPVCLTFGAPGYASNVLVTSAYPLGQLGKDYFILERTHVAIDRYTGAAAQQKLFTVEYVTAGAILPRLPHPDGTRGQRRSQMRRAKDPARKLGQGTDTQLHPLLRNPVLSGGAHQRHAGPPQIRRHGPGQDINQEDRPAGKLRRVPRPPQRAVPVGP
jgi:CRISPR/Cas system CSM-associated protein Csm3 (group 7 of RAMP superfamily)